MATTAFRNVTLLDCTGAEPAPRSTVIVEGGRIARVVRGGEPDLPRQAEVIDGGGRTLMPGLTDAHVHAAIVETDPAKARRDSPATTALRIRDVLEQTLDAGFTTVRDAFEEMAAASYEATARQKMTLAHVYTPPGILNALNDFPNTCGIGTCGCSPSGSRQLPLCQCGEARCFDGTQRITR